MPLLCIYCDKIGVTRNHLFTLTTEQRIVKDVLCSMFGGLTNQGSSQKWFFSILFMYASGHPNLGYSHKLQIDPLDECLKL